MNQPINAPKPPFRLTNGQRVSDTWVAIKAHLQSELDLLRQRNDNPALTETQTAALRGEINRLKTMLVIDKDLPIQPPESD